MWKRVFSERQTSCLYMHQRPICARPKNSYSVFHCFVRARIAFQKSKRLASTEQWHANHCVFSVMRKCVCGEHIKGMCQFSRFSSIANTLRPQWSERHLHFAHSKPLDVCTCVHMHACTSARVCACTSARVYTCTHARAFMIKDAIATSGLKCNCL